MAKTTTSFASTADNPPDTATVTASRTRGERLRRRDAERAPVVESGGGELRRQDHQPEQDEQRREVDGPGDLRGVHRAAGEQDDHGDQSDAGPIDAQTGKPPQSHSGIGGGEDSQDEEGHVGRVQVSLGRGVGGVA